MISEANTTVRMKGHKYKSLFKNDTFVIVEMIKDLHKTNGCGGLVYLCKMVKGTPKKCNSKNDNDCNYGNICKEHGGPTVCGCYCSGYLQPVDGAERMVENL